MLNILQAMMELSAINSALFSPALPGTIASACSALLLLSPLGGRFSRKKKAGDELESLKKAVETMGIGVTITGLDGTILYCNPAEARMHGYEVRELIGQKSRILAPRERWEELDANSTQLQQNWKRERMNVRKDGSTFPVQLMSNAVFDDSDDPVCIVTNCEDITERRQFETGLREREEKYRSLVESTDDSIYLLDSRFRYLFMNRKHLKRLDCSNDLVLGQPYEKFHSAKETSEFLKKAAKVFDSGESLQYEHKSPRDGRHFLRTISPVKEDSDTVAVTVISKDITALKRMEENLRILSLTDDLTGLYNRRGLYALVQHQLKVANRTKRGIYILYADLDNLKVTNDRFGHQTGDKLLVSTAMILKDTFRNSDIIARVGGDEFVVVPVGCIGDNIDTIVGRLKEGISSYNSRKNSRNRISLSFGLSAYEPEKPCTIDELLGRAERSMYELKGRRKGS